MQFLNNQDAYSLQKSLKIPKGQSESINGGRTDNTIAKRKTGLKDKKQSTKHTHSTIERIIRPPLKTGVEFPTSIKILKNVTKKNGLPNISQLCIDICMNLLIFFSFFFYFHIARIIYYRYTSLPIGIPKNYYAVYIQIRCLPSLLI
jgi:hypothetical protein